MSIRVAVIGAGIMGADHARIVAEDLPGATLQAVCDVNKETARSVADACGALHVLADPETTIARDDIDAVIVASPDFTHGSLSISCIQAGKPVLCEKPLSQSSAECIDVINAEAQTGRHWVQLGFMRRYDQSYLEMKSALDDGVLGRALMMHNFHRNVETPNAEFTGAMAISNSAPHEFDIARYVLGSELTSISAYQPRRSDQLVAPVFMVLQTADDQLVNIEINNNAAYGYDVRGELIGEKGSIALSAPAYSRLDCEFQQSTRYKADWRDRYNEAYRRQNKDFIGFVNTGQLPDKASSCWDGYCAALIAEAGIKALETSATVTIEPTDKPSLYI